MAKMGQRRRWTSSPKVNWSYCEINLLKSSGSRVIKRKALFRPAISSPYSGANEPKVVYIKHHTPFMSAVQRVKRLIAEIEKRAAQSVTATTKKSRQDPILAAASADMSDVPAFHEEICVKGTGRAIEKVLNLAAWFGQRQQELGIRVRLETNSTLAIDDIELPDDAMKMEGESKASDTRIRNLSVLLFKISLTLD
jgi:ribonuclease P/MRP protein subunit POP7